jgi:hypothetical protein
MARCCGGKNAGKPITVPRYLAGLAVFAGYHSVVALGLHAVAIPVPGIKHVRDFHRRLFRDELKQVLAREGIHVGGWRSPVEVEERCEVPMPDFDALEAA